MNEIHSTAINKKTNKIYIIYQGICHTCSGKNLMELTKLEPSKLIEFIFVGDKSLQKKIPKQLKDSFKFYYDTQKKADLFELGLYKITIIGVKNGEMKFYKTYKDMYTQQIIDNINNITERLK